MRKIKKDKLKKPLMFLSDNRVFQTIEIMNLDIISVFKSNIRLTVINDHNKTSMYSQVILLFLFKLCILALN
jgi:hypothetical protein